VSEILPKESKSGEIGHLAKYAFHGNAPTSWRDTDLSSDSDAGYDYLIQVVGPDGYSGAFHLQLKGTKQPAYSAEKSFVSVGLRLATLNYYKKNGWPVMLAVADLSGESDPAGAPVYYAWIHDQLDSLIAGASDDATLDTERTIRVPTANRLTRNLKILPDLRYRESVGKIWSCSGRPLKTPQKTRQPPCTDHRIRGGAEL
jgi:hypothetical protein